MRQLIIFTIIATVMISAVAVAAPNLVYAAKQKSYCGTSNDFTFCENNPNHTSKQECESAGLDCHNARQFCGEITNTKCSKP